MATKSIKSNFVLNFSYQILNFLIPLVTTPYISRVLSPEGIGKYSYSYSIAYYFVMFIMLGLNNYGNRTVAKLRDNRHKLSVFVINAITFKFILGVLSLILYSLFFVKSNDYVMVIMSLVLVSSILDITWMFFGLEEFKITVVRNTLFKIIATLCIFLFVNEKSDIYIYTLIMVSEMVFSQLYLWKYMTKYVDFIRPSVHEIMKQIKPNLLLFIPVIAVSLYKMMDKTMVGFFCGTVEVGYYETASRLMAIPIGFIVALGTVMLPRISNLLSKKDITKINYYFSNAMIFSIVISSLLSFGIISVSKEFVPLYFGKGYGKCTYLLYILMPACVFQSVANVVRTQYLIPFNKDTIYVKSVSLGAITNLVVNFLLIPKYQSLGAAAGTLVAETIVCLYQCFMTRKDLNISFALKQSLYPLLSVFIMTFVLLNINFSHPSIILVILKIIVGGLIFLTLISIYYRKLIVNFLNKKGGFMSKFFSINKFNVSEKISIFICSSILLRTLNITISETLNLDASIRGVFKLMILGLFIFLDIYLFINLNKKSRIYLIFLESCFFVLMMFSMLNNKLGFALFTSYGWILISFIPILIAFLSLDNIDVLFEFLYKFSYLYVFLCILIYIFPVRAISTNLVFSYTLLLPYLIHVVKYKENKNILFLFLILFETFMLFTYGSRGTIICILAFFSFMLIKSLNKKQIIYLCISVLCCFMLYQFAYRAGIIRQIYLYFLEQGSYIRVLDLLSNGRFFDNNGRFQIYTSYFHYIIKKPIFGWGIGANLLFDFFPHNVIIEIIFNFGLLSIFIFYIIFKLLKNYFSSFYKSDTNNLFLIFLCSGLIPLFFSSTYLEFMYFWIFIGFLLSVYRKSHG